MESVKSESHVNIERALRRTGRRHRTFNIWLLKRGLQLCMSPSHIFFARVVQEILLSKGINLVLHLLPCFWNSSSWSSWWGSQRRNIYHKDDTRTLGHRDMCTSCHVKMACWAPSFKCKGMLGLKVPDHPLSLWSPPAPWHSSSQGFCTAFLHDRDETKKQGAISFSDFSFWVKIGSHCPITQIRSSILCIRSTSLEAASVAGGHMCVGRWVGG